MRRFILVLTTLLSFAANASLIQIKLDKGTFLSGESITGQLVATNLTHPIGGFTADIEFDPFNLSLDAWSLGNGLDAGDGSLDLSDDTIPGFLMLSEFTWSDWSDTTAEAVASAIQGTEFILASFEFSAFSLGSHSISLAGGSSLVSFDNLLEESFGAQTINFSVVDAQVPAPLTLVLILTGLFLLRRKLN
mgnify:CR=1 FL=1